MKATIWGTRGSLPAPGPANNHFGGNTSCVQLEHDGSIIILDAGSGIRALGAAIPPGGSRIDILLTHLHLDHIMGLGFFRPLYTPHIKVNIWGPACQRESLQCRLARLLSPPLFPIRLQELPCQLELFEIGQSEFQIGGLTIKSEYVCHPGPTLGFRIEDGENVLAYLPDHEPKLGSANFPNEPEWTSGFNLAQGADLLFHDAQYTPEEYVPRVGWGHSTVKDTLAFAKMTGVKKVLLFHHDPSHSDEKLRGMLEDVAEGEDYGFEIGIAAEGNQFVLG